MPNESPLDVQISSNIKPQKKEVKIDILLQKDNNIKSNGKIELIDEEIFYLDTIISSSIKTLNQINNLDIV